MDNPPSLAEQKRYYFEHNRSFRIDSFKVGCVLVLFLMPAGVSLDYFVYPDKLGYFFALRMLCALLALILWFLLNTTFGKAHFRALGMNCFLLPSIFISAMIYSADGVASSYYAGLNLAVIGMTWAAQVEFTESMIASVLTLLIYSAACYAHGPVSVPLFFNNIYFIILTGIIVVTGSYYVNNLRFREFTLRAEVVGKTKQLEAALEQIKETESQIVHQAKMASLGLLSAGLMHEINNPLNFANTAFHLLRKRLASSPLAEQPNLAKPLEDIHDGIKRVVAITSSLRDFAHPDDSTFKTIDLAEVIASAIRFVHLDGHKISLHVDVPQLTLLEGNNNQLVHLFINLLQNSIDSLNDKAGPASEIRISAVTKGDQIEVVFRDNGKGIAPENLVRIYDAFFTTKKVGSGVGLGLNICHRIVDQHKGRIMVESEQKEFCQFNLTFPRTHTPSKS